jgi:hypothetical protein
MEVAIDQLNSADVLGIVASVAVGEDDKVIAACIIRPVVGICGQCVVPGL